MTEIPLGHEITLHDIVLVQHSTVSLQTEYMFHAIDNDYGVLDSAFA